MSSCCLSAFSPLIPSLPCPFKLTVLHPATGAGLGGGSGNAATALWAANEAAGRPASEADLLRWAGEIGSDISVFFSQGAAFCTGRYSGSKGLLLCAGALGVGLRGRYLHQLQATAWTALTWSHGPK